MYACSMASSSITTTTSSTSSFVLTGTKRGTGTCSKCGSSYPCRRKPKVCECGFELGGKFDGPKKIKAPPHPNSVEITILDGGSLRSVRVSQKDDRNFAFIQGMYLNKGLPPQAWRVVLRVASCL